jgi:hypothetical protein
MKEANHSEFTVEASRRKENGRKKPNDTEEVEGPGKKALGMEHAGKRVC